MFTLTEHGGSVEVILTLISRELHAQIGKLCSVSRVLYPIVLNVMGHLYDSKAKYSVLLALLIVKTF